ncbi:oxidoreductase family protein [Alkaliflexus imshenetskii]|uniref:oxidoreductase family protein n=1 Tax=Alkaliflexus imshenetskii TaxID=286730 RepID=UPI00047BF70C|nr:oxidoreductase family protein [Alkaliflexus imshenetskii]
MNRISESKILQLTRADNFSGIETIQSLWSGYGYIKRYRLVNGVAESVIVKHIHIPKSGISNSDLSHNRKLKSYQVEVNWYKTWNAQCDENCRTPYCYGVEIKDDEILIVLEDLNQCGFNIRKNQVDTTELHSCLKWLANFHATFMNKKPDNLWMTGTYWHLDTRPDELNVLTDVPLKNAASEIDNILSAAKHQTLVHGDAKLANFCFANDKQVAAVDFQYVGNGCGMKDVAYFIGSCMDEESCERNEQPLLNFYFDELRMAMKRLQPHIQIESLEAEWRRLFPVAWTDFHRFYKGWSPAKWDKNSYSEKVSRLVINNINEGLY